MSRIQYTQYTIHTHTRTQLPKCKTTENLNEKETHRRRKKKSEAKTSRWNQRLRRMPFSIARFRVSIATLFLFYIPTIKYVYTHFMFRPAFALFLAHTHLCIRWCAVVSFITPSTIVSIYVYLVYIHEFLFVTVRVSFAIYRVLCAAYIDACAKSLAIIHIYATYIHAATHTDCVCVS